MKNIFKAFLVALVSTLILMAVTRVFASETLRDEIPSPTFFDKFLEQMNEEPKPEYPDVTIVITADDYNAIQRLLEERKNENAKGYSDDAFYSAAASNLARAFHIGVESDLPQYMPTQNDRDLLGIRRP